MGSACTEKFCGRVLDKQELDQLFEIINMFPKLSRAELANTVCELLSWKRPTGKLKTIECLQFLERLDEKGTIRLPACRKQREDRASQRIDRTEKGDVRPPIHAKLKELAPLSLIRIETQEQRQIWYEYVDRYHYLGYQLPFGAQLRYFIKSDAIDEILGCFQFSSPAWRMAPRDRWIGWTDEQRKAHLQRIVNNSRFLILPWVEVKNLASYVLALATRVVPADWWQTFGYQPVLLETLVDGERFNGTCYKAANWIHLGETTGRGRMDRGNKRHGLAVKQIFVFPLIPRFREELTSPEPNGGVMDFRETDF